MKDLESDLKLSRKHEMKTYISSMKSMYANALMQNGEIYDIASALTDNFQNVCANSILEDSRIIKILRYSVAPSISQMKFGQFFGLTSIDKFENDKVAEGTSKFRSLEAIADRMASFINENIDLLRFIWLNPDRTINDLQLAYEYSKKWTCSIAADQNAQTRYRNWRKNQQEHAIATKLVEMGYVKSSFSGIVKKHTDINIGEFTQEVKVKGRTVQKADVIIRSKKSKKLVLIEAKAVGVEIDSTKRIKECCDKANDWRSSHELNNPTIVSVIAGFFNETGISNLLASDVQIIWEHRLSDFSKMV